MSEMTKCQSRCLGTTTEPADSSQRWWRLEKKKSLTRCVPVSHSADVDCIANNNEHRRRVASLRLSGFNSRCRTFISVCNQPPMANSAFHPIGVGKWVPASAGKAKAGMVHSVSGWTRGVQVKLWDALLRAIPERLRGVITTRRYTNPRLPLPYLYLRLVSPGAATDGWSSSQKRWSCLAIISSPFPTAKIVLSNVLCKFSRKKIISFGCHPLPPMVSPGGSSRHTVEVLASAIIAFSLVMTLTFDLWPWKPFQPCPLTWWTFVPRWLKSLH